MPNDTQLNPEARRVLRQKIDAARRARVSGKELMPQADKLYPVVDPIKMTDREATLQHARHQLGMTVLEISRDVWRKYGYKSPMSCYAALRHHWKRLGLVIRDARAKP